MYPLKFQPVFQQRIWGGQRLRNMLGKALPKELQNQPVGESWELADLPAGTVKGDSAGASADGSLSSLVTNGPWQNKTLQQILTNHPEILSPQPSSRSPKHFPLLVKFLDAQTDLSVQVHPDAAFCQGNPGAHPKSEAWFIIHAEPGAKIYKGVKPGVTKEVFRRALERGQVEPLLNAIRVRAGDCHYLQSGTVHALGAGILAAEVQTPSDTTFRVFDWNRLGPDGKARALHIEQAMGCINFASVEEDGAGQRSHSAGVFSTIDRLVACDYFTLERVCMIEGHEREISYHEPVAWIILEGQGLLTCDGAPQTAFTRGDTLLMPANMKNGKVKTVTACAWLEAKLPGGI